MSDLTLRVGFYRDTNGENDHVKNTRSSSVRSVAIGLLAAAVTLSGLAFPAAVHANTTGTTSQGPSCPADTICDPPTITQDNANLTISWTPPADQRVILGYEVVVDYYNVNGDRLGRYSIPVSSDQRSKTIKPEQEQWNPWADPTNRPAVVGAMVVAFVAPGGKITTSGFTLTLAKAADGSLAPGVEDKVDTELSLQGPTERPTVISNSNKVSVSLKAARGANELPIQVWFTPAGSSARELVAESTVRAAPQSALRPPDAPNYGQAWSLYTGSVKFSLATNGRNGTITVTYAGSSHEYESDNRQGNFAYPLHLATDTAASASFKVVHSELKLIGKHAYTTKNKLQRVQFRYTNRIGPAKVRLEQFKHGAWVPVATRDVTNPPFYFGSSLPKSGTHQIAGDPSGDVYSTFKIKATKKKTKYRLVHVATSEYPSSQPQITTVPTFSVRRR